MFSPAHTSTFYAFSIAFNAALGSFFFGYSNSVWNGTQDLVLQEYGLNDQNSKDFYHGLGASLMPFGAVFGAFIGGVMAGKLGRKRAFIYADIIGIIGSLLCGCIDNLISFFIGRFICGVSVGINSAVVPLFINDVSPPRISGVMGSITSVMINFGSLIPNLFAISINYNKNEQFLRWFIYLFPIITSILRTLLLLTVFNVESPIYLLSKNDENEAKKVLSKFYDQQGVEAMNEEFKKKNSKAQNLSYFDLFKRKYRSRTLLGIFLVFAQQFSGINAILNYSNTIFKDSSLFVKSLFANLIVVCLIVTSFLSGLTIDVKGRKIILVLGEIFCIITLFLSAIFSFFPNDLEVGFVIVILVYCFAFGMSLGPIVWLYLPEILPNEGVSLVALFNWVFTGIVVLIFPIMQPLGDSFAFFVFGFISLFCLFGILIWVKETKDKTDDQIEALFLKKEILLEDDKGSLETGSFK